MQERKSSLIGEYTTVVYCQDQMRCAREIHVVSLRFRRVHEYHENLSTMVTLVVLCARGDQSCPTLHLLCR